MSIVTTKKFTDVNYLPKLPGSLGRPLFQGVIDEVVDLANVELASKSNISTTGSNANGKYVKFADGTMICIASALSPINTTVAQGNLFATPIQTWTFPATFYDNSIGYSIGGNNGAWGTCSAYPTAVFMTYTLMYTNNDLPSSATLMAIGRWKA